MEWKTRNYEVKDVEKKMKQKELEEQLKYIKEMEDMYLAKRKDIEYEYEQSSSI